MENSSDKIVSVLNDLVQINNDRREGYKSAAAETKDFELKSLFEKNSQQSSEFATELSEQVIIYGGVPVQGTRTDGKLHRAWMDIKTALTGHDRHAILGSCEFGEDAALKSYHDALVADVILPENLIQLITRQRDELEQSHDTVRTLRDLAQTITR